MSNVIPEQAKHIFSTEPNLSMTERAVCVVGGLALAAVAAKPRPNMVLSLIVLIAGSALAIRGATGHCPMKAALDSGSDGYRAAIDGD
jgi:uncharacterized membrane protein